MKKRDSTMTQSELGLLGVDAPSPKAKRPRKSPFTPFNVLVHRCVEDGIVAWNAQVIGPDVSAAGRTADDAIEALTHLMCLCIAHQGVRAFDDFDPVPETTRAWHQQLSAEKSTKSRTVTWVAVRLACLIVDEMLPEPKPLPAEATS